MPTIQDTQIPGTATSAGRLALTLQEVLTLVARVRTRRQVAAEAETFRYNVKRVLEDAAEEARRAGYQKASIVEAGFAVIAFLDESVINSALPMFADWPRRPLQEEIFGDFLGGEVFFDKLRDLLARQDSGEVADVLEVYLLCLLMGFEGRYRMGDRGALESLKTAAADKIVRIRGTSGDLSPSWMPPDEAIPTSQDPVLLWLGRSAVGLAVLLTVLWGFFWVSLRSTAV
jgi:type VI secretion system protein ImpK